MGLTITRLGHHGDGVADGPVFVPRTLPGEVVEGEVTGDRMAAPRILTPSPERIAAPCPQYKACGGCALQHAREAFVTDWKEGVIRQALAAQGLEAPFHPPHISPKGARRRATFSGRRLKKGALVGFHARASDTVASVPDCLILRPDLTAALPVLEELVIIAGSRKGEMALSLTTSEPGLDLSVTGGKPLDGPLQATLGQWAGANGLARLAWEGEVIAQSAPPAQSFGRARVTPPPGAFLQATAEGQSALQSAVAKAVGDAPRVADLFAGCGTFALPLAERAEVHAVESLRDMLAALDHGWRHASGLKRLTHETRDLFRNPLLPEDLARFDAVVIDPPRAGAEAQAHALAESTVARIAAVSCNPVTFARDAKILLQGGYRLEWVQMIDQFRFSPHVELAAAFAR
ncbi:23S rRNA (uracil(1939)-C(5))-methyltransferase RlmD [Roseibaca ekhonensis]|jgi:23S rRNA (uracil1939-C5)-methyltransferase|uniref:23S rRNA (Uracil(1939)-C(5))-methyltransferase RlmD n=1 Tax=Roseinatronobacter ekhonensis TaxID=254356 RepID=A0A3B0MDH0_9RHOB|nr:class I SAM-dependent RNA methyltransferase [Roseibaca ekhonensis]SUZ31738.1 23S rRNA (uracil(1939)-C(5))-methyltransferase RlmD [Roseibaca ekhonensis]